MPQKLRQKSDSNKAPDSSTKPANQNDASVLEAVQGVGANDLQRTAATPTTGDTMSAFQRSHGNQFVQRLSKKGGVISGQRAANTPTLRRSGGNDDGGTVHPHVESRIQQEQGRGEALPEQTRQQMEMGIGADFEGVQVHNDAESHTLNRSLNARAFTSGQDIFFGEGEYNPHSSDGQELIAHEMTHVVQQGGAPQAAPQTKMAVNEPDDPYEQEADTVAKNVVRRPQAPEETPPEQAADMPMAQLGRMVMAVSLGSPGLAVQREEEQQPSPEEIEAEKDEQKQEAENKAESNTGNQPDEAPGQAAGENIEKTALAQEEADAPTTAAHETLGAMAGTATPVKPPTPMEPPTAEDLTPELEPVDLEEQPVLEETDTMTEPLDWNAVKPPNWDVQVAAQETFLALFDPDEGLMHNFQDIGSEEGAADFEAQLKTIQRQSGSGGSQTTAVTSGERDGDQPQPGHKKSAIPGAPYELPTAGDDVGGRLADVFIIDPIAGNAVDVANSFAAINDEPNSFSGLAATLEAVVKIMELVTSILGMVALVLTLLGGLMMGLGWALIAAGTALMGVPFMQGVAGAMLSAGGWLQGWGATFLSWATSINALVFKLTVIRAELRILALILRGLSVLAMLIGGASKEEIDRQLKMMQNQAIGLAVDGITIGLTYKIGGGVPKASPAGTFIQSGAASGKAVGIAIGANILRTGGGLGMSYTKDLISRQEDEPENGLTPDGEEQVVLPPIPWDAVAQTNSSAANMMSVEEERQELEMRLAVLDDALRVKENWGQAMTGVNTRAEESRQHLTKGQEILQHRAAVAEEYSQKSQALGEQAKGLESSAGETSSTLEKEKSHIETGAKQAEERGQSDPAMKEGNNAVDDSGKAPDAAADVNNLTAEESRQGQKVAAESTAMIGEFDETDSMTEDLQSQLSEKSEQNTEEIDILREEREALLARLDELVGLSDEEAARQEEGQQEAESWTAESQTVIDENKNQALGEEKGAEFDSATEEGAQEIAALQGDPAEAEAEEA